MKVAIFYAYLNVILLENHKLYAKNLSERTYDSNFDNRFMSWYDLIVYFRLLVPLYMYAT